MLNLQKIEVGLARQKNYDEAQKIREEWQDLVKMNFVRLRDNLDKKNLDKLRSFTQKQKAENNELNNTFKKLRADFDKSKKEEQSHIEKRFSKIFNELESIQVAELKEIEKEKDSLLVSSTSLKNKRSRFMRQFPSNSKYN